MFGRLYPSVRENSSERLFTIPWDRVGLLRRALCKRC